MTRNTRGKRDPVEHEIEVALNPGAFISDRACFSFVNLLHEVAIKIARLTGPEPSRAVELYETFLAGCYEKVEELDDSSGSFGQFVGELHAASGRTLLKELRRMVVWWGTPVEASSAFARLVRENRLTSSERATVTRLLNQLS